MLRSRRPEPFKPDGCIVSGDAMKTYRFILTVSLPAGASSSPCAGRSSSTGVDADRGSDTFSGVPSTRPRGVSWRFADRFPDELCLGCHHELSHNAILMSGFICRVCFLHDVFTVSPPHPAPPASDESATVQSHRATRASPQLHRDLLRNHVASGRFSRRT